MWYKNNSEEDLIPMHFFFPHFVFMLFQVCEKHSQSARAGCWARPHYQVPADRSHQSMTAQCVKSPFCQKERGSSRKSTGYRAAALKHPGLDLLSSPVVSNSVLPLGPLAQNCTSLAQVHRKAIRCWLVQPGWEGFFLGWVLFCF